MNKCICCCCYSEVVAKFEDIIPVIKTSIAGTGWVGRYCIGKVSLKHSNLNQYVQLVGF